MIECPICGERKNLAIEKFPDEDGRPKIRVTCSVIAHERPVVTELDDPDFAPVMTGGASGLVRELDLYAKLEEIVATLPGWVEYGVFEHLFAHAYPDDYRRLWRKFGHIATDGPSEHTLSAYLGLLLGNLARAGGVAHKYTVGTGRWSYNDDISALAHPARANGPVTSWEDWSTERGFDPEDWPAVELLLAAEGPILPDHRVLILRLTDQYREGMSTQALYEATRGWWRLGRRRELVDFVFSVHAGEVQAVYRVEAWEPAPDTRPGATPRWGFVGQVDSDLASRYVGVDVTAYLPPAAANPVRYVNVPIPE